MVIYYINYEGINCSVFESQIYTYCNLLNINNIKVTLINFETNIDSEQYKDRIKAYSSYNNLRIISIEKNKKFDFIINKKSINQVTKLINEETLSNENIIIHGRGILGSFIGLKVRKNLIKQYNIKVISDFRGAVVDEYLLKHKNKGILFKIILKILIVKINSIQSKVCKNSDSILCLSKKSEEYLKNRYTINCRVSIIPACIDAYKSRANIDEIIKKRNEMNLENRFVAQNCCGAWSSKNPKELKENFKVLVYNYYERQKNIKTIISIYDEI